MQKQFSILKAKIGVVVLMGAGAAFAAPYEVSGPDEPKPHEQTAIRELSAYLGKRVAGTVRIGGKDGVVFRVGDTALARREGLLSAQLPPEKWVVRSFGNEVLLNGGGPRGALFAVYHFLEDCCGVRWWSEFEEDVPPPGPLDLPSLDLQGRPVFAYRDIYRSEQGPKSARFERRVRMNAHGGADLGGAYCFGPPNFCHTFDWYLNADRYMKDHPEWFSLRKGRRVGGQRSGQLCLTNPEVKDEMLKRLLANIEKGMERARKNGVEPPRIYDISHNDNRAYCECDRCKVAAEKYGLSGVNLNFVNALAADVAKKYPDVLLCTWAYQYTQPVPKGGVRAADNVIVRLCDTGSNQAASIAEPDNRAYYDCVMAWSKVTKHLFVWDYAITFSKGLTGLPFPSEFHYGDLFRHYRACNVSGIFWEHEHPYKADMWELKFFLETKLMENPDLDCNALIERFMREYYGPAGEHVLAYRRYLDKIRREKHAFVSWFPQLSAFKYISDEDVAACNRMLDAAEESVAGDAKLLARVRHARLGLDRLACLRSRSVMFHAPGGACAEERKVPGLDAAKARLRDDWPKWIAAYPRAKDLVKKELDVFAGIITPSRETFPVPEQFRDRGYYDFPAQFLSSHGKNVTRVDDSESPVGRAMRTMADKSHYYKLPFSGGVYDTRTKKSLGGGSFAKVAGDGYHWYRLGKVKFSDNCYLWLTRAWTTQLRADHFSDLSGKELELWVSVKFTGPMFRPGTSGDSFIWIDRVLLEVELPLEQGFLDPPKANRPQVWWWFDATAPDAAITRDLEGLKRVGISGFHIYGGSVTEKGWLPRAKWALHEANRLGLDGFVMIGAAGCGHAQTDPRHAQKDLVFTEARMESRRPGGETHEAAKMAALPVNAAKMAALPVNAAKMAALPVNAAKMAAPYTVTLPKKGVKETPKNADGSPKYYWDIAVLAVPDTTSDVLLAEVRDVSRYLNRETGVFEWPDAPEGKWRIFRVGYVPKVFGWMGCYIDHTSRAAFDAHWARVMTPLLEALAPDERAALKGVMCDSWEAGTVSWTDTFAEEFRRRRGYDILPWLPAKAGVRLVSGPKRARFLRDFNETVSELIAENHYAYQKEVANRHGLVSIAEAAGPHQRQGDVRRMQGRCDVAMGELWMPSGHRPLPPQRFMVRDAANAAHVYGMGEVLAESFTTINTYWIESPATMKPCADRAFCDGLTRVCYHGMMLSPSLTDKPGFIRSAGTHYNPQTTWFDQSDAFNLYLSRCSWMLSQGRFVADCLIYAGDAVNLFAGLKTPSDGLGEGFDYDICPTELLLQARVEDGQIVLPSGMRYRVLLLSDRNPKTSERMRPGPMKSVKEYPRVGLAVGEAAMLKIRELVEAGATLAGPRPSGPTSMNDSSARYHAAADALWGPRHTGTTGVSPVAFRSVGKGRVFPHRAAARAHLTPDVTFNGPPLDWIHRTRTDGTDIYFLSNQKGENVKTTATFRQPEGRVVELWDAVTGERAAAGRDPRVELELPAYGSRFVVFRDSAAKMAAFPVSAAKMAAFPVNAAKMVALPGPWSVAFDSAWGGPKESVTFDTLVDWTVRPEPGIRHYSGTATYRMTFDAPSGWQPGDSLRIDLGTVHEVATVFVNGTLAGTVWTAPYAVTASNVKEKGNVLEVRVTNLWPNRLIYDAGLPEVERLTHTNINPYKPGDPLLPSGLLGPVQVVNVGS